MMKALEQHLSNVRRVLGIPDDRTARLARYRAKQAAINADSNASTVSAAWAAGALEALELVGVQVDGRIRPGKAGE